MCTLASIYKNCKLGKKGFFLFPLTFPQNRYGRSAKHYLFTVQPLVNINVRPLHQRFIIATLINVEYDNI